MENQDKVEPSEWKEKMIYELAADGTCEFEDEKSIPVSRAVLAFHSKFFTEAFFGLEPKTEIKIKGFDRASFKTFLDCLFGVKEYTLPDALVIYPIAHRYEVKESLDKCTAALKPKEVDENVSQALNLTTFYKRNELTDYVIKLVKTEYGIVNFLDNKKYSFLLEPLAMIKLIENVDFNSLVWTSVYQWGENYLKQREKSDIKSFFVEHGIFEKISLAHFESAKAIIDFHVMSNKQLLCSDEILFHLGKKILDLNQILPDTSDWIKIDSGHSFSETIVFKNLFYISGFDLKKDIVMYISTNNILLEPEKVSSAFKIKARYIYREIALNVKYGSKMSKPERRTDLNFFYREKFSTMDYLLSPFSLSDEFSMEIINGKKRPIFKSRLTKITDSIEIHSVKVTYCFDSPCWILKASLDPNKNLVEQNEQKNLYFTNKVPLRFVEKGKKDDEYEE